MDELLKNLKELAKRSADDIITEDEYYKEYKSQVDENDFENGLILYLEDEQDELSISTLEQLKNLNSLERV